MAASMGILTQEQVDRLAKAGIHRYNHNLETAKSYFPQVVTTHTWEERHDTLRMVGAGKRIELGIVSQHHGLEQLRGVDFLTPRRTRARCPRLRQLH